MRSSAKQGLLLTRGISSRRREGDLLGQFGIIVTRVKLTSCKIRKRKTDRQREKMQLFKRKKKNPRAFEFVRPTSIFMWRMGVLLQIFLLIAAGEDPWVGIPVVKVPQIGQHERVLERNSEEEGGSGIAGDGLDIQGRKLEEALASVSDPIDKNLDGTDLFAEIDERQEFWTTTDYPQVLTELEDLEEEWRNFDEQVGETEGKPNPSDNLDERFRTFITARSVRALIWPLTLAFGTLAVSGMIIMTLCLTRKQIYCCGQPCFNSSLEAASNYDRSAMRKEKIKMIKRNPLATRSLDKMEIEGIVECFKKGQSRSTGVLYPEEFMQEYDRRILLAARRFISTPIQSQKSDSEPGNNAENSFCGKKKDGRGSEDLGSHEYDEVVDVHMPEHAV